MEGSSRGSGGRSRGGAGANRGRENGDDWDPMKDAYEDKSFNSYPLDTPGAGHQPLNKYSNNPGGATLFVGSIPYDMTEEGLGNVFQIYGNAPNSLRIVPPKDGTSHKFGFATFAQHSDAESAIRSMHKTPPHFLVVQYRKDNNEGNNNRAGSGYAPRNTFPRPAAAYPPGPVASLEPAPPPPAPSALNLVSDALEVGYGTRPIGSDQTDDVTCERGLDEYFDPYSAGEFTDLDHSVMHRTEAALGKFSPQTDSSERTVTLGRPHHSARVEDTRMSLPDGQMRNTGQASHNNMQRASVGNGSWSPPSKDVVATGSQPLCQRCMNPATNMCSLCKVAPYCSSKCAEEHWPAHKFACLKIIPHPGVVALDMSASGNLPESPPSHVAENALVPNQGAAINVAHLNTERNKGTPIQFEPKTTALNTHSRFSPRPLTFQVDNRPQSGNDAPSTASPNSAPNTASANSVAPPSLQAIRVSLPPGRAYNQYTAGTTVSIKPDKQGPDGSTLVNFKDSVNLPPNTKEEYKKPDVTPMEAPCKKTVPFPKETFTKVQVVESGEKDYWVTIVNNAADFKRLNDKMVANAKSFHSCQPSLGLIVAAWYMDGWYRAEVTSITPLQVFYIDFGNKMTIHQDKIRQLPDEYTLLPAQARHIHLQVSSAEHHNLEYGGVLSVKPLGPVANGITDVEVEGAPCQKKPNSSEHSSPADSRNRPLAASSPRAPTVASSPRAPTVASSPRAPTVASSPQAPTVASSPRAPAVASSPQAPTVASSPRAPAVASSPRAPTVASSPKTPDVAAVTFDQVQLPPGKLTEMVVTYAEPGSFWAHPSDQAEELWDIAVELLKNNFPVLLSPEVGDLVCAQYEKCWYRGLVLECGTAATTVHLIDYGNIAECTAKEIRTLPQEYAATLAYAINIKYQGNQVFEEDDKVFVKPVNKDGDGAIFAEVTASRRGATTSLQLPEGVFSKVEVQHASTDKKDIWIQLDGKNADFPIMMEKLNSNLKNSLPRPPEVGDLVLSCFDGLSCRALVRNIDPIEIYFIDYGNTEIVLPGALFSMPDDYKEIPGYATHIQFSPNTAADVRALTNFGDTFQAKPVDKAPNGATVVEAIKKP